MIAFLALVLMATPARAQDRAERAARAHFQRAEKAFNLGKFADALKAYEQAYDAKPLPGLLFNIAQCHRNLDDPERALFFYKRYLTLEPASPNRSLAEELVAEQEKKLAARRPPEPSPPPSPVPPPPSAVKVARQSDAASPPFIAVARKPPAPSPEESKPLYKRWWFWGAAAVVAGGAAAALLITREGPRPTAKTGWDPIDIEK